MRRQSYTVPPHLILPLCLRVIKEFREIPHGFQRAFEGRRAADELEECELRVSVKQRTERDPDKV